MSFHSFANAGRLGFPKKISVKVKSGIVENRNNTMPSDQALAMAMRMAKSENLIRSPAAASSVAMKPMLMDSLFSKPQATRLLPRGCCLKINKLHFLNPDETEFADINFSDRKERGDYKINNNCNQNLAKDVISANGDSLVRNMDNNDVATIHFDDDNENNGVIVRNAVVETPTFVSNGHNVIHYSNDVTFEVNVHIDVSLMDRQQNQRGRIIVVNADNTESANRRTENPGNANTDSANRASESTFQSGFNPDNAESFVNVDLNESIGDNGIQVQEDASDHDDDWETAVKTADGNWIWVPSKEVPKPEVNVESRRVPGHSSWGRFRPVPGRRQPVINHRKESQSSKVETIRTRFRECRVQLTNSLRNMNSALLTKCFSSQSIERESDSKPPSEEIEEGT